MSQDALLACGLLIPVTYILLYVLGGALRPDCSHVSDSVSELLSPGAPNKPLLGVIQTAYAILHVLFGLGVLGFVRDSGSITPAGLVGAWMIVALGVATLGTTVFPQDAEGTPETRAGKAQFSILDVEPGIQGAVRSLQRLGKICSWSFYRRYTRKEA